MEYIKEQSIELIRERIAAAIITSPIAVFINKRGGRVSLNSVFASTVLTDRRIKYKDPDLVGVYHQQSNKNDVRRELHLALAS